MSVMGFQKKIGWEVGGWGELYPIFLDFWHLFNFAKPLTCHSLNTYYKCYVYCTVSSYQDFVGIIRQRILWHCKIPTHDMPFAGNAWNGILCKTTILNVLFKKLQKVTLNQ